MCIACQISVNDLDNATEDFAGELIETLNRSTLALGISLGHRTGLFDTMSHMNRWATSAEIAETAQCHERYVREWLGIMVTGGIVALDSTAQTFFLPVHHAALLTRSSVANNFAKTFQFLAVLAEVETPIVECFQNGGGVPYEMFTRFHDVMAEDSDGNVVAALFDTVLPLAPGIVEKLERGIDVLDIGCGRGRALTAMAERFPNSRFVGRDLCREPIESAQAEIERRGLRNIRFEVADVSNECISNSFDFVTAFDVIHDQRDPAAVLARVREMLRPGGTFLMQDLQASSEMHENVGHPLGPFLYTVSTMHCMTVSLAQGGMGLGTVWGEQLAVQMLGEAGFENVAVQRLDRDIQNNWYVSQIAG